MGAPRAWSVALGATVGALGLAWAAGCEAVPDIYFVDDARADGPAGDAGSSGALDSGAADASSTTCVAPSPGAGATCCGTAWCTPAAGTACTPTSCAECEKTPCPTGDLCCAKPQGALCKKTCP